MKPHAGCVSVLNLAVVPILGTSGSAQKEISMAILVTLRRVVRIHSSGKQEVKFASCTLPFVEQFNCSAKGSGNGCGKALLPSIELFMPSYSVFLCAICHVSLWGSIRWYISRKPKSSWTAVMIDVCAVEHAACQKGSLVHQLSTIALTSKLSTKHAEPLASGMLYFAQFLGLDVAVSSIHLISSIFDPSSGVRFRLTHGSNWFIIGKIDSIDQDKWFVLLYIVSSRIINRIVRR